MTETDATRVSAALREIPALQGLEDAVFDWLVAHGEEQRLAANEIYLRQGEAADRMVIVLEGELNARVEDNGWDGQVYVIPEGGVSGMLPFSRMTHYAATVRAGPPPSPRRRAFLRSPRPRRRGRCRSGRPGVR